MNEQRVAVLGAGSWGSALAHLLGSKGHAVMLWDRDPDLIAQIQHSGVNTKYLPELPLGETVTATSSLPDALEDANWAILAVSSDGVRAVISEAAPILTPATALISAAKGLEADTGLTVSEIIHDLLIGHPYAGPVVLSGPNLANELVRGIPSASVVASTDPAPARAVQALLMTERTFRIYTHTDVKGVELGGALKNVLAIGGGISDGLGFGDNTKAALLTRGLMEMTQIGVAAGGDALTFLGLSGVGDLLATATSRLSRNYRVGLGLSEGRDTAEIVRDLHRVAEGVPTARAAQLLARRYGVTTPVFDAIAAVLDGRKPPASLVEELMSRNAREEFPF
jgi:glycerol-3-phosphate dehydrogenase (NAD(P)+)